MEFIFVTLGNEVALREKILSIPLHLAGHHKFPNNEQHKSCSHGELSGADRHKLWLSEGSKVSFYSFIPDQSPRRCIS